MPPSSVHCMMLTIRIVPPPVAGRLFRILWPFRGGFDASLRIGPYALCGAVHIDPHGEASFGFAMRRGNAGTLPRSSPISHRP